MPPFFDVSHVPFSVFPHTLPSPLSANLSHNPSSIPSIRFIPLPSPLPPTLLLFHLQQTVANHCPHCLYLCTKNRTMRSIVSCSSFTSILRFSTIFSLFSFVSGAPWGHAFSFFLPDLDWARWGHGGGSL